MTLAEFKTLLDSAGYPVAYRAFNAQQALPFICWLSDGDDNFAADGRVYHATHSVRVELYTETKDTTAETAVEAVLRDLYYTKEQTYIDEEQCYATYYELEV